MQRLLREVWTWEKLVHPNITPLLGYRSGETPVLITPYYENGNLAQYLEHNQQAPRLRLLVQAAAGLEYLHECSPIIVHGDIKPDNVLVNDFGDAALCDFGLAHTLLEMRTGLTTSGLGQGCLGFIAPEIIAAEGHKNICRTTMSDVYAVGGLILNVLSDRIPFYHLPPMRVMMMVYQGDMPPRCQHPEIDPRATIWELMESCWQHDPQRRPDMGQVCLQLHGEEAYFSREGRLRRHGDHQGSTMVGVQHPNNSSPTISGPFLSDSTMDLIAGDSGGDSETEGEGSGSETSDDGDDVTTELRIPKGSEERS
ncbi:hypothetical protein FRB98_009022 [Tulasnella sp. 332]|nr:hypothetical protein FRB98_009022 [Tulasnella sp. 332]